MAENEPQKVDTKEYVANYPGFRIASGIKIPEGDMKGFIIDLSMFTDNIQGFQYYQHGYYKQVVLGTSYEMCGIRGATDVNDGNPEDGFSKIIAAGSGHILIEAQDGDVILKGRNVRLQSTGGDGEITLKSTKHIHLDSPIVHLKGTNINILGANNLSMAAQFVETTGGVATEVGTQTDIFQGSFMGSIMKWLDKFKDFL